MRFLRKWWEILFGSPTVRVLKDRVNDLILVTEEDWYWQVLDRSDVRFQGELTPEIVGELAGLKGECVEIDYNGRMNLWIAGQPQQQRYIDLNKSLYELFSPPRMFKIEMPHRNYQYVIGNYDFEFSYVFCIVNAVETGSRTQP